MQEIDKLLNDYTPSKVVIKKDEGRTRSNAYEQRVQHEAAVMIAATSHGVKRIVKKVSSTIAKDLGQKGRGSYLAKLDTTWAGDFDAIPKKEQDAVFAAWSEL